MYSKETEEQIKEMEKHLGGIREIELESLDKVKTKFKLSPLPVEELPRLFKTIDVTSAGTNIFGKMDKAFMDDISELGLMCLKPNYPEVPDEKLKELILRNVLVFANEIWAQNLNMPIPKMTTGDVKKNA